MIRLDMGIMELSTHDLPPGHHERNIAITEAGEGKLALFSSYGYDSTCLDYYTTTMQNRSDTDDEWKMMSTIALPLNHRYYICGAAGGCIFVTGFPIVREPVRAVCFSVEVKSLKIERLCSVFCRPCDLQPYFGNPPPMSLRVIKSGKHCIVVFASFLCFALRSCHVAWCINKFICSLFCVSTFLSHSSSHPCFHHLGCAPFHKVLNLRYFPVVPNYSLLVMKSQLGRHS